MKSGNELPWTPEDFPDVAEKYFSTIAAEVKAALPNHLYVDCHWFQYTDQAVTGRYFDGEAYQVGFVSVTDTPYHELVEACRETASKMYSRRAAAKR